MKKPNAQHEVSHSTIHHLIAVAELLHAFGYARVTDVAKTLGLTGGSVSITLKSMERNGLVTRDPNGFVLLSPRGEKLAREGRAKKRKFKEFLEEVLGVPEEIAEADGCSIDHLLSPISAHRICTLMQFMRSGELVTREFLEKFERFRRDAAGPPDCEWCGSDCVFKEDLPDVDPEVGVSP